MNKEIKKSSFKGEINGVKFTDLDKFIDFLRIETKKNPNDVSYSYDFYEEDCSCSKEYEGICQDCNCDSSEDEIKQSEVLTKEIFDHNYKLPVNIEGFLSVSDNEKNKQKFKILNRFTKDALKDSEKYKYCDEDVVNYLKELRDDYVYLINVTDKLLADAKFALIKLKNKYNDQNLSLIGLYDDDCIYVSDKSKITNLQTRINYYKDLLTVYYIYQGYYFELYNLYTGEIVNYL